MGSGGRIIGKLLAQRLGVEFYDKQLLTEAAAKAGLIPEFLERDDERTPSTFSTAMAIGTNFFGINASADDAAYRAQSDMIRELGSTKSCVIVGRTADYILRHHPRCISIFIHAPEDACVARIMERGDKTSETEARAYCRKVNKLRSSYYNFYTDRTWGDATTYHLTVNSAHIPLETLADILATYVRARLA